VGTTSFGGGGFTVWGCFSLNCKIDLYVIDGTLRGHKCGDQILRSLVVPHFEGHPLASRPILMDGNARPHNPSVPEHVSSFRESSVAVCVEGTAAIPEPKHSLILECFDTSGYVRSLFVLDSPINALSDSYPVTWLTRVVSLLPLVADSLALYGLCGLALPGNALVQGWQQYPQHRLRRLIHGMRRRVQELYRMRGGYIS
jgi:hypothetical protein